ncbi:Protein bem46 [Galdieria sulphuraria]|nr:Protein bem46 [Galdieria sulphuraria]
MGMCEDALEAYDNLHLNPKTLVIWGESIGGGMASYVASKRKCAVLVLASSISSMQGVLTTPSNRPVPVKMIASFIGWIFPTTLPVYKLLRCINCPVVIFHSSEDTYVSVQHALINYENAKKSEIISYPW